MDDKLGQEFPLARGGDDDQRTTYLDHAGAGLYSKSQVSSDLCAERPKTLFPFVTD